ncbi:AsmA family protein [Rahnella inusitata]|uniref:AsmA family protein n=1 Tax=Rahnella inusitata TaxID=58169 RepID=A0ABX9NX16_9GAMM|nr:AsmA family protein [Rahnella inusitata]RJT10227.1 AsmA family protein [Rahnella inusitata]
MRFIGKILLTFVLLLVLAIVLVYVLLQTRWAAGKLSTWVTDNSDYRLAVEKVDHDWSTPGRVTLTNVIFGQKNQPETLSASEVDLDLSWRQITEPRFFDRVVLVNGRLNVSPSAMNLPLQANTLQLSKMALTGNAAGMEIQGQQINAGISPWQPKPHQLLGDKADFQLSAANLTVNGLPTENVLIQGNLNNKILTLGNFGGDLARGQLTGKATQAADGSWNIENLRLSNVRLQTSKSLSEFFDDFQTLPKVTLKRLDLIDARLQGTDWAFSDVDLSVQDVTLEKGDWQSDDGEISLNATDMINGNLHIQDPIINLDLTAQGISIKQATARWERSLLRTTGNWLRANKRLQLDELSVAGLEYTLPQNWRQLWLQPLPDSLAEISIGRLIANRNLIIDIDPQFPFQLTALDGLGNNLLLARNHQWGIWNGKLNLNASEATFNRNDVRRPSITLEASDRQVNISELSAFTKEGLLEATGMVDQQPQRQFSVKMTGRAVPANQLENWGWPHLQLDGNANMQLNLQGQMPANVDYKPTLNGTLQVNGANGQIINQRMLNGLVSGAAAP